MYLFRPIALSLISSFFVVACHLDAKSQLSDNFASGNLGVIKSATITNDNTSIQLDNDNHNSALSSIPLWRNWWYFKLSNMKKNRDFNVIVDDIFSTDNQGWQYDYTPVYSYDQKHWQRFNQNQIDATTTNISNAQLLRRIEVDAKYDKKNVYVARFYPYTPSDLDSYYQQIKTQYTDKFNQGFIRKEILGMSPKHQLPIEMFTITDPNVTSGKKRIWIQARTHAAETGSSFVVEGIINTLLADETADINTLLSNYIFNIVPMYNPDGVFDGNYRTNSYSINLENTWKRSSTNPMLLTQDSPTENLILNKELLKLSSSESPFIIALNLHSTQSQPQRKAFFFPHFGSSTTKYTADQIKLWNNTNRFIDVLSNNYRNAQDESLIEAAPADGGNSFVENSFPESWWWANFGADVMAVTMETTYEKAGYQQGFLTPERLRHLGKAMVKSVVDYINPDTISIHNTSNIEPVTQLPVDTRALSEEETKR